MLVTPRLSPSSISFREKLRLDPGSGVSTKYLLASLESDPERLTKNDQVWPEGRPSLSNVCQSAENNEQVYTASVCVAVSASSY